MTGLSSIMQLSFASGILASGRIFDAITAQAGAVSLLEVKRRKLEKKLAQAEKDIKSFIRVQLDSGGDPTLYELYASELKQLKEGKDADTKLLRQIQDQLMDLPSAKHQRETVHTYLKELRAAWGKAPASLRKRLLRSVLSRGSCPFVVGDRF